MRALIIDVGNTRSKLAVVADGEMIHKQAVDSLNASLVERLCTIHDIDAAVASVVGRQPDFASVLPARLLGRFHLLNHLSHLPISIDYETPETLGMDRVAAAVGARALSHSHDPLLVVDAGTCITIDLLDQDDCFRGGAIAPGLQMRLRALHDYTASLPLVIPDTGTPPFAGRNTRDSILSGVLNAAVLELQGFAEHYMIDYPSVKVFLTGGDADFFAKRLFFPNFANPNLVYTGLYKILEINI